MFPHEVDPLAFETALRQAQCHVACLPPNHIPLLWIRELAIEAQPVLLKSPAALELLVQLLSNLGVIHDASHFGHVTQARPDGVLKIRNSMTEAETKAAQRRLREFCSRRLEESRLEKARIVNRIMTGDPDVEVTAWTVPPIEDAQARAAHEDRVTIVVHGGGSYSVRVRPTYEWEEECLTRFAEQVLQSTDFPGVIWALKSKLLSSAILRQEECRLGSLHETEIQEAEAGLVAGLYWLTLAHKQYGEGGSAGGSWHLAGRAVNVCRQTVARHPNHAELQQLLKEAEEAHWLYDP